MAPPWVPTAPPLPCTARWARPTRRYRADLASALSGLGGDLDALGQYRDARSAVAEAVELYRALEERQNLAAAAPVSPRPERPRHHDE